MRPGRVLLVDDDRTFRISTAALLREEGHDVQMAGDATEAVDALGREPFDLMLLDVRMPGIDGIDLVEVLRQRGEDIPILMISGFGTVDGAVRSLQLGADDFLTKPVEPGVLIERVAKLLERRPNLRAAGDASPGGLLGRSPAMQMVFDAVRLVAPAHTTVLITGETGTGKELVARSIHDLSPRAGQPFLPVNCAALAEGLLESELFGHVRGAFTGAVRDRTGLFQAAHGGTIFLDEVGDMSPAMQHRLLRVIQERELTPVGSVRAVEVDVRVIAATNQDLRARVAAGRFREDLFYRLNVFRIELPPLRDRRGDVPLLVEHRLGSIPLPPAPDATARPRCSPFAMRLLQAYPWPGNVRELFSVIESAAIRAHGGRIEAQHLPAEVRGALSSSADGETGDRYRGYGSDDDERAAISAALRQAEGVRTRAAEILGMGRTTLWRKIKQYGLEPDNHPNE